MRSFIPPKSVAPADIIDVMHAWYWSRSSLKQSDALEKPSSLTLVLILRGITLVSGGIFRSNEKLRPNAAVLAHQNTLKMI